MTGKRLAAAVEGDGDDAIKSRIHLTDGAVWSSDVDLDVITNAIWGNRPLVFDVHYPTLGQPTGERVVFPVASVFKVVGR